LAFAIALLYIVLLFFLISFFADIPFVELGDAYRLVLCCLKGPTADKMREESEALFTVVKMGSEDSVEEHLTAWAQHELIPMFTCRNKKAFPACNYRPDFTWLLPGLAVMLECDLDAHSNYDKDS
jgi:hypothetical protein